MDHFGVICIAQSLAQLRKNMQILFEKIAQQFFVIFMLGTLEFINSKSDQLCCDSTGNANWNETTLKSSQQNLEQDTDLIRILSVN